MSLLDYAEISNKFIEVLKASVLNNIEIEIINNYITPPKRKKNTDRDKEIAGWYNQLSDKLKRYLIDLIREGANSAVFGFLCILDGVRAIDNEVDKGSLELYYKNHSNTILLNNQKKDYLHDIFLDAEK